MRGGRPQKWRWLEPSSRSLSAPVCTVSLSTEWPPIPCSAVQTRSGASLIIWLIPLALLEQGHRIKPPPAGVGGPRSSMVPDVVPGSGCLQAPNSLGWISEQDTRKGIISASGRAWHRDNYPYSPVSTWAAYSPAYRVAIMSGLFWASVSSSLRWDRSYRWRESI